VRPGTFDLNWLAQLAAVLSASSGSLQFHGSFFTIDSYARRFFAKRSRAHAIWRFRTVFLVLVGSAFTQLSANSSKVGKAWRG
jgi:hypothetical protein